MMDFSPEKKKLLYGIKKFELKNEVKKFLFFFHFLFNFNKIFVWIGFKLEK